MANLHKRSVQEALNATVGGNWTVNSPGTAGSSADVTNSIHLTAANDLVIPKNTLTFVTVPRGLGNTVYFNYNSTSTTTGAVKTVEI